jgi:hypothetical protein
MRWPFEYTIGIGGIALSVAPTAEAYGNLLAGRRLEWLIR